MGLPDSNALTTGIYAMLPKCLGVASAVCALALDRSARLRWFDKGAKDNLKKCFGLQAPQLVVTLVGAGVCRCFTRKGTNMVLAHGVILCCASLGAFML